MQDEASGKMPAKKILPEQESFLIFLPIIRITGTDSPVFMEIFPLTSHRRTSIIDKKQAIDLCNLPIRQKNKFYDIWIWNDLPRFGKWGGGVFRGGSKPRGYLSSRCPFRGRLWRSCVLRPLKKYGGLRKRDRKKE